MAGKRKSFKAAAPVIVWTEPDRSEELNVVIVVPKNPSGAGVIDLGRWLGHGIDAWVWACAQQLRVFLRGKSVAASTVVSYAKGGLAYFFEFLTSSGFRDGPLDVDLRHIELFVTWLREHPRLGQSSQKNVYAMTKSVLLGLMDRGLIPAGTAVFPRNPFPGINRVKQGQAPLSSGERARLADALRTDIVAAHTGSFGASDGQMLAVYALALALRTGLNTTPLLELRRDCLKPHPFMPRMRLLETFKRRGNATQIKSLRYTRTDLAPRSIPMDGVALLEYLLKRNEPLAAVAPPELRDAVWLYRAQAMAHRGKLTRLTEPALKYNIHGFVQRHSLVGDDGKPLELTMSRLRKTMENRLWRLSNGDLFTVSAIMGHDPKVADQSYLAVTPEMRANATIVGEALPDAYRTADTDTECKSAGTRAPGEDFERTPVGRCKDSRHGDRAPRDGTHCMDFLSCFGCRSYAIVGSREDLHRLFSFYWFLDGERQSLRSRDWTEHFASVMTQIDSFTLDKFDHALVREAKEWARCDPLKFWRRRGAANEAGVVDGT